MKNNNNTVLGYAAVCSFLCLSGISFVWTKRLLENGFPVFTIVLIRLVIGAAFLLSVLKLSGKLEVIKRKDWLFLIALAKGEPFIYFIGEDFGMKYADASFASVMMALVPVAVAFAVPFVYGTKIKKRLVGGAVVSLAGICLMSFDAEGFMYDIRGVLLFVLALCAAVWYNIVLQKLLKSYGAFTVTAYMNMIGALMYLPLFFIFDFPYVGDLNWNSGALTDLVCLGVLCSAGSYGLYAFASSQLGVEKVSVFNNVAPVVTVFAAVGMGMETFSVRKVIGVLIVVISVILSQSEWNPCKKV